MAELREISTSLSSLDMFLLTHCNKKMSFHLIGLLSTRMPNSVSAGGLYAVDHNNRSVSQFSVQAT